jgi:hypothetical protein
LRAGSGTTVLDEWVWFGVGLDTLEPAITSPDVDGVAERALALERSGLLCDRGIDQSAWRAYMFIAPIAYEQFDPINLWRLRQRERPGWFLGIEHIDNDFVQQTCPILSKLLILDVCNVVPVLEQTADWDKQPVTSPPGAFEPLANLEGGRLVETVWDLV